mgnify:CR=1 FL=1
MDIKIRKYRSNQYDMSHGHALILDWDTDFDSLQRYIWDNNWKGCIVLDGTIECWDLDRLKQLASVLDPSFVFPV